MSDDISNSVVHIKIGVLSHERLEERVVGFLAAADSRTRNVPKPSRSDCFMPYPPRQGGHARRSSAKRSGGSDALLPARRQTLSIDGSIRSDTPRATYAQLYL
jgi:hypothetical protein